MTRSLRVGGAQMGPIQKTDSRATVIDRMLRPPDQARAAGCDPIVYAGLTPPTFLVGSRILGAGLLQPSGQQIPPAISEARTDRATS